MVRVVIRIGVDFRTGHECKTGLGGQLFDEGFLDIAAGGGGVLILLRPQAVLFDPQDTAWFQGRKRVGESDRMTLKFRKPE